MQALTQRSLTQYVRGEDGAPVLVPDLATDLGRSNDDHTEWRFTLRDGATWEDGSAVTPAQVAFGITRTLDVKAFPLGPGADYTRRVPGRGRQEHSGPYARRSRRRRTRTPRRARPARPDRASRLSRMSSPESGSRDATWCSPPPSPIPRWIAWSRCPGFGPVPEGKVSDPPGYGRKPWATGPYRVKRLVPGKRLVLVANGQWQPASDPGSPPVRSTAGSSGSTGTQAEVDRLVLAGGKRARHTVATVSGHAYPEAAQALGDRLVPQAAPVRLHAGAGPHQDHRRSRYAARSPSPIPTKRRGWRPARSRGSPGCTRTRWFRRGSRARQDRDAVDAGEGSSPRTDPERARELLAEAGHEPGDYELTMLVHEDDPRAVAVQERVTRALRRGGFAVRVLPVAESPYNVWGEPKSALDKKLNVRAVSLCADWPSGSGLVEPLLRAGSDYNTARFAEESVEQELDRIAALPPTEQDEAWAELDERVSAEQLPYVPTGFRRELLAFGQGVGNPTGEAASGGAELPRPATWSSDLARAGSTATPRLNDVGDTISEPGLFDAPDPGAGSLGANTYASAPLAVRMRPRTLDELVGQAQLRAPGSPLRRLVEGDQSMSLLLWGPPGTGKTTIAGIVSQQTDRRFVEVSAVAAGVKEVRAAIDAARAELSRGGRETVLFVDEVHRFTKAQQDALLPGVENRWVTLVAATTENPFFSVISPLLSRSLLLRLESLTDDDVDQVIEQALTDERGLRGRFELTEDARAHLVRLAGGDARRALTYLEAAAGAAASVGDARPPHDRPGAGRDRGRPGGRALRPPGRPALRRHQRLHQVGAGLRRGRRAALPGPDGRGGGGPSVHRPSSGHPGQRGRRPRRPDRADHGGGRRPGGRS